eukprot:scaffold4038_cov109-Skeletonema_dohrnii-CCMP3373.AAC.6
MSGRCRQPPEQKQETNLIVRGLMIDEGASYIFECIANRLTASQLWLRQPFDILLLSAELHKEFIMSSNEDKVTVSLGAEYLYTWEAELEAPIVVPNGPNGTRAVVKIAEGTGKVYGPALNGRVVGPSSDWILIGTDGSIALDVRVLIQTEDEQIIYQKINGRAVRDEDNPSNSTIQSGSTYETSSGKYQYLNKKVVTGLGRKTGNKIKIMYYDVQGTGED